MTSTVPSIRRSSILLASVCVWVFGFVLTIATAFAGAQERYVRAEETRNHELVITTSSGRQVVVPKSDQKIADEQQVGFRNVAISPDGTAVGWVSYYPNCCTSYPVPMLVEVYSAGRRRTFDPAIAPWDWCFVDGSAKVAARSTTVHGPQNELLQLWDIASGKLLDDFTWMEGETYPRAPAWVVAIRAENARDADSKTHICTTKR